MKSHNFFLKHQHVFENVANIRKVILFAFISMLCLFCTIDAHSAVVRVAYIYGDVSSAGIIPSGTANPFHQMLLTDTGDLGCSVFKSIVENEGYQIDQYYDRNTTLDAAFLNQFNIVIFSLHQKIWSVAEKSALDLWIQNGGGVLIYSDSASGGAAHTVGKHNTVGQKAVNNITTAYGMQVTADQANGIRARQSSSSHSIVAGGLIIEGEGVSPVAVDPNSSAQILIPFTTGIIHGPAKFVTTENITINNPIWAALALRQVGNGNVIVMFDRQPMWNNGPGSNIKHRDNALILKNIVKYLASSTPNVDVSVTAVSISNIEIYPNPVSLFLNIKFSNAEITRELKIFNSLGQLVFSTKTESDIVQINVQELKIKGIAMLQIVSGNQISTHKILIK